MYHKLCHDAKCLFAPLLLLNPYTKKYLIPRILPGTILASDCEDGKRQEMI